MWVCVGFGGSVWMGCMICVFVCVCGGGLYVGGEGARVCVCGIFSGVCRRESVCVWVSVCIFIIFHVCRNNKHDGSLVLCGSVCVTSNRFLEKLCVHVSHR